jgi:hypothetical protein
MGFVVPKTGVWPVAVALAAACCVSACGTALTAAKATTTYVAPGSGGMSSSPSTSAAASSSRRTPAAALTNYLRQTAEGKRLNACEDATPVSSRVAECMSSAGTPGFNSLHESFALFIKFSTPISVTCPRVTGTSVTISASSVRIAGTSMVTLILKHSTGIKADQFSMSWDLERVGGSWYVANMNMNVG